MTHRKANQLGRRRCSYQTHDSYLVVFRSLHRDMQHRSDYFRRFPFGKQLNHIALPRRQDGRLGIRGIQPGSPPYL